MPIMDGFSFIEAFKKVNSNKKEKVLIVIVSSSADPKDLERAKDLGIEHFLTKPITEAAIRPVLDAAGVMWR